MTSNSATAPSKGRPTHRRDPLWLDVSLLLAVAVVVCLVSLPRLRGFAVHGNERDAQATVALFGSELDKHADDPNPSIQALLAAAPRLEHRMRDVRSCDAAGVIVHHGYCFTMHAGQIHAWPLDRGRTGRVAYRSGAAGALEWCSNGAGWSGIDLEVARLGEPGEGIDWVPLQR
tara:strand:- start:31437 stop:31958 length:522 start_codon:yes stop_codon:yes gene_type:complete